MRKLLLCAQALLPMMCAAAAPDETVGLAGAWRFALDRSDVGINEAWPKKELPDKIQVPGILEAQGYGDEISTTTPWVLSLYDRTWHQRADYAPYTKAGDVKVPFLCQPPRHYLGAAWYQREIEIPKGWSGKRTTLFLERPKWKATVWLDDKEIGSCLSLCTPHEFDFGLLAPGKHRLTVRVDNRMILPYRPDSHGVSDSLTNAWNGIVGKTELRATPAVWAEDVQVFPAADAKSARVRVHVNNATGGKAAGKVSFLIEAGPNAAPFKMAPVSVDFDSADKSTALETVLPCEGVKMWDEFTPALYKLRVAVRGEVAGKSIEQNLETTFGFRDFRADGPRFMLNGRPAFLRGTHFGGDFPLTGYPPTDTAEWKRIFKICQDHGLNHMRFHSWCPPEAAFEAADELGFYLQPEPGMWNPFSPGSEITKQLYTETERIIASYGNHPSFLCLSASNEAAGRWKQVLPEWVQHFRGADPRRLYTPDTGWSLIEAVSEPLNDGADYLAVGRVGNNRVRGDSGWFGRDFQKSIDGLGVPVVSHEVGQWCAYPDFRVIEKFKGFMRPGNYEIFRDSAAKHGLLEDNAAFARASGALQLACYKEEIEAALRTPGLGGFQLLDLHDYTGQGTALIGVLDPMWNGKGYSTPEGFKKFCNTVVPLARLKQRTFTTADKFEVPVEVANFGVAPLEAGDAAWRISDAAGAVNAEGKFKAGTLTLGKNQPLGKITTDLSKLAAPERYTLAVKVGGYENTWDFWLYPADKEAAVSAGVVETSSPVEATKALAEGKKVLFTPRLADLGWTSPPLARVPIFWNALMGPNWGRMLGLWCDTKSPALAGFPTDESCGWQWSEIVSKTRAVNLDKMPRGLKPIVSAVDDWNRNYKLGVVFEATVGTGKLLVCSANLTAAPVGLQLHRSLLDYMAGDKFQPKTAVTPAEFGGLFFDNLVMKKLNATATADGQPANGIVDGDPNTYWCSADVKNNPHPKPPHEIVVTFPQPVAMTGLVVMPRQNHREHQGDIREYKLETSDDGAAWQTVAQGQLASTFDPQTVAFGKRVTAKQLRLTALSGFGSDESASVAELAVNYAGPALPENEGSVEYRRVKTASPDIDAGGGAGH
ncbi:discoidin domain-containing protein [Luteolibacter sp. LG18]|uniref:discoidin domain-containing protein n=1 Tax=Luteolibacter sp. LG18 TaxID=2819286 RepID=UPI002B30D773|nr:beta-glucuronidase [Luteolibacter sp. LG18]